MRLLTSLSTALTNALEINHFLFQMFCTVYLNYIEPFIGVARNFDWGGPQIAMTSSEILERETFVGQRYRRMEDQKPWSCLPKLKGENVKIGRRV